MKYTVTFYSFWHMLAVVTLFQSCESIRQNQADKWFRETRKAIGGQSNRHELAKADSVVTSVNKDGSLQCESRFAAGHVYIQIWTHGDYLRRLSCYSDDGQFEWRREYCAFNDRIFEGIFYHGYLYGPSTRQECNTHEIAATGISYRGEKVGIWKELRNGRVEEIDYKNTDMLQSMPSVNQSDVGR